MTALHTGMVGTHVHSSNSYSEVIKKNSVALVRERTIPTERPPPVGEVSAKVRFPALPDFLSSSGSGTGSTQPREVN